MPGTLVITTLSDGTNSTSSTNCIQGSAKVWVNFNGTTSPGTIRAFYNVTSVTRNGTGDYTINITNALGDANYAVIVDAEASSGAGPYAVRGSATKTASSFRFGTASGSTGTYTDLDQISVAIFD